jgi:dihydrofolate reductase
MEEAWHDDARCLERGCAWQVPRRDSAHGFVLTHEPPSDPPDPEIRFVSGMIEDAVAAARDAAGGGRVGIFGAGVARQLLAGGLLDEIVVHVVPVLLGAGVRLYGDGVPTVTLERIGARCRSWPICTSGSRGERDRPGRVPC